MGPFVVRASLGAGLIVFLVLYPFQVVSSRQIDAEWCGQGTRPQEIVSVVVVDYSVRFHGTGAIFLSGALELLRHEPHDPEATYSVPNGAKYVRVEITDETGKKAWSNPFFF